MEFYYCIRWIFILYYKLCMIKGLEESSKVHFTNSWAVHIENGNDEIASQIAEKHGFYNFGQIGSLPGYYQFVHKETRKRRKRREVSKTVTLLLEDKIQWVEQQHVLERDKRSIIPDYIDVIHPNGYTIQDPMYNDQWYINNVGQSSGPPGLDINVLPVWSRGISGKGVVVAILDDGLDHTHPDLKANYDAKASYDFNDYDEDPMPRSSDPNNCHGTKCAGEVAAEAGNGVCGVGVAFNSSVGGIRMLDGNVTDTIEGSALSYHKDYIDIYSCAWGPKDDGKRFGRPGTLASKALELGVKEGRNGLGSIFVWATGNGGLTDDDCNCDGYTTSVYTVSIGAISDHGLSTYYTESCASTLAVTYSGGSHREKKENKIVTTTLGHKCTDEFKGTSSAAPLAAGMIALVLESNSNVTWRDIQHIIVETSVMSSPLDEGWRRNGAGKWFNQKFGFGRMDAAAMVEKATTWTNVMEQRNCWSDKSSGPWTIPSSGTLLVAMNTTACAETTSNIKSVEHVQVVVSLQHRRRGHLSIELISPSGTRTQLLKTRRNDRSTKGLKDWVFMSVHFWGEDPKGLWTLAVTDNNNNDREHHLEKNKYGDMEDATGALQDLIEDKEDTTEHEKIVEDDDLFKSAEEFENQIFKDATYRRKGKEKLKEGETHTEQSDADKEQGKNDQGNAILKNIEDEKDKDQGKVLSTLESVKTTEGGSTTDAVKEISSNENRDNKEKEKATQESNAVHKESNKDNNDNLSKLKSSSDSNDNGKAKEEKNAKKETKSKSKETKKEKSKHKEDEKKASKVKSSEKSSVKQKSIKKKSHSKTKSKKKKKLTVEEEAEEKIVEELLKDSKPVSFQNAIKPKPADTPAQPAQAPYGAANQTAPFYPNYPNVPASGAPMYSAIKPYTYPNPLPFLNVTSNYQAYLPPPLIPPPGLQPPRNVSAFGSALSVVPSQASPVANQSPAPPSQAAPVPAPHITSNITNVTAKGSNGTSTQENNTLENVLRNVLTEVFTNFKQENQGYKILADRIEGLELALQDKNKTQAHSVEQTYSSVLLNAFKKGKPIDKIQNVLGVLENRKNLTKHQNSSFSKNAEVVTDVLKVLKDILSTKKDDSELKGYKKRISKLLETSSNSTRQLTEKLFSDIEPAGDAKESSTSVMNDALSLISQIFQRNKPHQSAAKVSKDLRVSLKGVAGSNTYNGKENENVESLTKEQATVSNPHDNNDYEPLTNILLHGDFLNNGGGKDKEETPMGDVDKFKDEEEEISDKEDKNENVPVKTKASESNRKTKDEYEIVGIAEKNGEHIITSPDNGNEMGMNKPGPEEIPSSFKADELAGEENSRHHAGESQQWHHDGVPIEHHGEGGISHREEEQHHPEAEAEGTHQEGERHHKLIHIGELQDWHSEGEQHIHEEEPHQRHHDRELEEPHALFHSHEEENGEDTHVGKHDFPSEEGEESKKDLDDDAGDFTIAIMKGGKKIGERKVNKFTASHYLIKPKFGADFLHDEDTPKTPTNEEDVLLKSNIFDYNRGMSKNTPKEHDSPTPEDTEKSIFDYNRGMIKNAPKDLPTPEDSEKSSIFDYSKGANKNRLKDHDSTTPEDKDKNSIFDYSKGTIKKTPKEQDSPTPEDSEKSNTNPETPNLQKEADFDVTKFALNENRFSEHTTDHAGKHEAEDVAEDTSSIKEVKPAEELISHKSPAVPDLKEDKEVKEYNEEKSGERMEKEQKDTRPVNSKRKLDEEESEIKKVKGLDSKKPIKKVSSKARTRKLRERGHRKYEDEFDEHYVHFNEPLPFMQLPDPSQFAQLPVQAEETENFVQPTFDSFNPNGVPNVVNVPDYRDHATFFSDNGNGYEVENGRRLGDYDRKRSDIPPAPVQLPPPMQDIEMYPSNEIEEFANEHEGRLLRRRRSVDTDDEPPSRKYKRHDDPLFRVKRDTIEQDDDDEDDGPHVVKRSAIITEIFPSETPKVKPSNEKRSTGHHSTKRTSNTRKSSFSAKRSAVRKATDIINSDRNSKEKPMSKESSSVLNIIKRVHDDIALGNSKDLRRLEAELARLEGISMSESNEQVNSFEKLAKERMNTVRTKVSKKYKEDPDEYYKYGASASGILESWTLHFYGTGP